MGSSYWKYLNILLAKVRQSRSDEGLELPRLPTA